MEKAKYLIFTVLPLFEFHRIEHKYLLLLPTIFEWVTGTRPITHLSL